MTTTNNFTSAINQETNPILSREDVSGEELQNVVCPTLLVNDEQTETSGIVSLPAMEVSMLKQTLPATTNNFQEIPSKVRLISCSRNGNNNVAMKSIVSKGLTTKIFKKDSSFPIHIRDEKTGKQVLALFQIENRMWMYQIDEFDINVGYFDSFLEAIQTARQDISQFVEL